MLPRSILDGCTSLGGPRRMGIAPDERVALHAHRRRNPLGDSIPKTVGAAGVALLMFGCEVNTDPATAPLSDAPQALAAKVAGQKETAPIVRWSEPNVEAGTSRLIRTPNGITFNMSHNEVGAGHAFTIWIVIFNYPEHCAVTFGCGLSDILNPDRPGVQADVVYGTGHVIGGTGKATFAGHRSVNDKSGSIFAPLGIDNVGLLNPKGAEIHLVVHDHGMMNPAYMPDMIKTAGGGCATPGLGPPLDDITPRPVEYGRENPENTGYCVSTHFAVHQP